MNYRIEFTYRSNWVDDDTVRESFELYFYDESYMWPAKDEIGSWRHLGTFKTRDRAKLFAEKHRRNHYKYEEFEIA